MKTPLKKTGVMTKFGTFGKEFHNEKVNLLCTSKKGTPQYFDKKNAKMRLETNDA